MSIFIFTTSDVGSVNINVDGVNFPQPKGILTCRFKDGSQALSIINTAGSNQSDSIYNIDLETDTVDVDGVTVFADAQALCEALTPLFFLTSSGLASIQGVTFDISAPADWVLDGGSGDYYFDVSHGLGTKYLLVNSWDTATDDIYEPLNYSNTDDNTTRVWSITNTISLYGIISKAGV